MRLGPRQVDKAVVELTHLAALGVSSEGSWSVEGEWQSRRMNNNAYCPRCARVTTWQIPPCLCAPLTLRSPSLNRSPPPPPPNA